MALNAKTVVHTLIEGKFDSGDFLKRLGYKGGVQELVPRTQEGPGLLRFQTRSSIAKHTGYREAIKEFVNPSDGLTFGFAWDNGTTVFEWREGEFSGHFYHAPDTCGHLPPDYASDDHIIDTCLE